MRDPTNPHEIALVEEPLAHTQRLEALGRVTAAVAHDFNNLLTIISGYAHLGQAEGVDPAAQECFAEIEAASRKGSELTRQLLAFGGRQELSPTLIDLNAATNDFSSLLRRVVPAGIDLHLRLSTEPVLVFVDPSQLEQVLLNLVLNSRDAIVGRGVITVSTSVEAPAGLSHRRCTPCGWLQVSDTGAGISREARPHIFDPFFTTKPAESGTGLGLATIRGIVAQSGGAIFVDSTPGEGTTMTVAFRAEAPSRAGAALAHVV